MTAIVNLRTALAASALALTVGLAFVAGRAEAAQLQTHVTVEGNYILAGDIFTGLEDDGLGDLVATRLLAAPEPGDSLTLSTRHLNQIAFNHGVDWRGVTGMEQVVITRPGRMIRFSEIEPLLRDELDNAGVGIDGDISIEVAGRKPRISVPKDSAVLPRIVDFGYDDRSRRFSAVVEVATQDGGYMRRTAISGRAVEVVEIPVLAHRLQRGTVIGPQDIAYETMDRTRIRGEIVVEAADLVGMEARRTLSSGRPLRTRDIGEPTLVQRGGRVTMVYRVKGMTLTASGRAQDSGPEGAEVRVVNSRTNTTVMGVVNADGTVIVGFDHQMAMN